jgi:type VI protein secretion system component VasK
METLKRYRAYWQESFKKAREAHAMTNAILAAIFAVVAVTGQLLNIDSGALRVISSPITHWISVSAAVLLIVLLLLWVPFARHEDEQRQFAAKMADKEKETQNAKVEYETRMSEREKEIQGLRLENSRLKTGVIIHSARYGAGDNESDASPYLYR